MSETQWALASVRDENDNLRSVWVEIPVEQTPYASDPFGEAFRRARVARRVSLRDVAKALHLTAAEVSRVERGVTGISADEHAAWWFALVEASTEVGDGE